MPSTSGKSPDVFSRLPYMPFPRSLPVISKPVAGVSSRMSGPGAGGAPLRPHRRSGRQNPGRLAPDTAGFTGHERPVAGVAGEEPRRAAVTRRRTRHRPGVGAVALVERGAARHLLGLAPHPVDLIDHERLLAGAAGVGTTRGA